MIAGIDCNPTCDPDCRISAFPLEAQMMIVGEEEQLESSLGPTTEDPSSAFIKEEQGDLWISRDEEQLQGLGAVTTDSPFIPVPLKSEEDEEKPRPSQLSHSYSQTEPSRETESFSRSSTLQVKAECDGDDRGGSEPDRNFDLNSLPQPHSDDRISDALEAETDDSEDWIIPSSTLSGLHSGKNTPVPLSDSEYDMNDKSTTCTECGKTFSSKSKLNRHVKIHTGEKPFSCPECGNRFLQKVQMVRHMVVHTGEKPFSCSECGKRFGFKGDLKKHFRIHTGEKHYSCPVCSHSFTLCRTLVKHMRTHTGERPFTCSVCGKRFSEKGNLTTHARMHTGEKPFSCTACDKRFTRKFQLKNHKCAAKDVDAN